VQFWHRLVAVCAFEGELGTGPGMDLTHLDASAPIADRVVDLENYGRLYNLLMGLSRYVDNIAGGLLAGNVAHGDVATFVGCAAKVYNDLRDEIVGEFKGAEDQDLARRRMQHLDADDVFATALLIDQSQLWMSSTMSSGSFADRIRITNMQFGIEAATTTQQFGELRNKIGSESSKLSMTRGADGTYL
jgi:hypothetical protein